jgi:hypothetical protein
VVPSIAEALTGNRELAILSDFILIQLCAFEPRKIGESLYGIEILLGDLLRIILLLNRREVGTFRR